MTRVIQHVPARHAAVEDYLGPADRRFFGKGYKRADQKLRNLVVTRRADSSVLVSGRAAVHYPQDWSRKGTHDQPPHLSTIDVLLFAAELGELALAHGLRLDAGQRAAARVVAVRIKAGRKPVEDGLDDFPVEAVLTSATTGATADVSRVDCQIGALSVELRIAHAPGTPRAESALYPSPDTVLGASSARYYARGHKAKTQFLEDLWVDTADQRARALVRVHSDRVDTGHSAGLDSANHANVSYIDTFVAALQLGQILLYELDGVQRSASNTLWMRQTDLAACDDPADSAPVGMLEVHLAQSRLLPRADGSQWRSADIVAELNGIRMTCSVAHQLPQARSGRSA